LQSADENFIKFLRRLSRKGFYAVLVYINENGESNYNAVLKAANSSKVINGRTQFNAIIKTMTEYGLLERTVLPSFRPARTTYKVSKKGKSILHNLRQIESEL
jgi:DNA-binding HxlR family transcriptional regulator